MCSRASRTTARTTLRSMTVMSGVFQPAALAPRGCRYCHERQTAGPAEEPRVGAPPSAWTPKVVIAYHWCPGILGRDGVLTNRSRARSTHMSTADLLGTAGRAVG